MPISGLTLIGRWGTVMRMTGRSTPARADPLQHLQAAQLALQQGVDHEHVGTDLGDLVERLPAIGQHVEQLHLVLRVQQVADVLRDLGDVLDQEQANMRRGAGHRATIQKQR